MILLNPLGLLLLLSLPTIVYVHLLRQERREREVSSLYLWRQVIPERSRRARRRVPLDLNLLLQLAAALLAALALAHPHLQAGATAAAPEMILLIDDSASMQVGGAASRMGIARNRAREIIGRAPSSTRIMLVTAGPRPTVVQTFTNDRALLYEQVRSINATDGAGNLGTAIRLVRSLGAGEDTDVVLITDGAVSPERVPRLPANLRIELVDGADGEPDRLPNRAITAFDLRARPDGGTVEALIAVANYADTPAEVVLRLSADGEVVSERRIALAADEERSMATEMPGRATVYSAELAGNEDALAADDRAYAVAAGERPVRVQLVTPGNVFLESFLAIYPNVSLTVNEQVRQAGAFDLLILDRVDAPSGLTGNVVALGTSLPDGPFAPSEYSPLARAISVRDHPVVRGVRLDQVQVARVMSGELSPRATVVAASGDRPLLYTFRNDRLTLVGSTFVLSDSDLPVRTGFPVLMHNIIEWLAPVAPAGEIGSIRAGSVVPLYVPPGEEVIVTAPDGMTYRSVPQSSPFEFSATSRVGVYEVHGSSFRSRFAVSLADGEESNLAVRLAAPHEADPEPGDRTAGAPLWHWLTLVALLLLVADWLVWARRH